MNFSEIIKHLSHLNLEIEVMMTSKRLSFSLIFIINYFKILSDRQLNCHILVNCSSLWLRKAVFLCSF